MDNLKVGSSTQPPQRCHTSVETAKAMAVMNSGKMVSEEPGLRQCEVELDLRRRSYLLLDGGSIEHCLFSLRLSCNLDVVSLPAARLQYRNNEGLLAEVAVTERSAQLGNSRVIFPHGTKPTLDVVVEGPKNG